MRALTWQGKRKVSVEEVADPVIQEPTDAVIRITASVGSWMRGSGTSSTETVRLPCQVSALMPPR